MKKLPWSLATYGSLKFSRILFGFLLHFRVKFFAVPGLDVGEMVPWE